MDRYPFKDVSMKQIEDAIATITALTGMPTRIELGAVEHISDGADRLIGQQRQKLGLVVMTERVADAGENAAPKH